MVTLAQDDRRGSVPAEQQGFFRRGFGAPGGAANQVSLHRRVVQAGKPHGVVIGRDGNHAVARRQAGFGGRVEQHRAIGALNAHQWPNS